MDIKTWVYMDMVDRCWLKDSKLSVDYMTQFSQMLINDDQTYTATMDMEDKVPLLANRASINVTMKISDFINLIDRAYYDGDNPNGWES